MYAQLNFAQHSWQGNNFALLNKKFPLFLCPSDRFQDEVRQEENFGAGFELSQSDYAALALSRARLITLCSLTFAQSCYSYATIDPSSVQPGVSSLG